MVIVFAVPRWYLTRQPWKNHPPGTFSFPVLGSMPFLKDKDMRKAFVNLGSEYGSIARIDLGVQTGIVVNGFIRSGKYLWTMELCSHIGLTITLFQWTTLVNIAFYITMLS